MKTPAKFAGDVEHHPKLFPGNCRRVSGDGVIGLTFRSGHVSDLRPWTDSPVDEDPFRI